MARKIDTGLQRNSSEVKEDNMTPFKDGQYTYTEGSTVFRILIKNGQPYISSNNPAKRFVDIFKVLNPSNWENA